MNRTGKVFVRKQTALIIAVLFVVNSAMLSGCSGLFGETAQNAGKIEVPSVEEKDAVNQQNGQGGSDGLADVKENVQPVSDNNDMPQGENGTAGSENGKSREQNTDVTTLPADVDSTWSNSLLLFLPRFDKGIEEDRICEETFDHIIFGGIESKRTIEDYIEEVKAAGFDIGADYIDHNGEIDFHAHNSDGWYVTVEYDINTAKADIGCGFISEEKEKSPETYFDDEVLSLLPMPETGSLSGGKKDGDYPYALYEGCTLDDALGYSEKLRKAGFDEDVSSGETGDLCWYNAVGPDGYICDMQYADGIIMIGCDREEE